MADRINRQNIITALRASSIEIDGDRYVATARVRALVGCSYNCIKQRQRKTRGVGLRLQVRPSQGNPAGVLRLWPLKFAIDFVQTHQLRRPWTQEDDAYLEFNIHSKSTRQLAWNLKRSMWAVRKRAHVLGLGYHHGEMLTSDVAAKFDVNPTTVRRWVIRWQIPVRRIADKRGRGTILYDRDAVELIRQRLQAA